MNKRMKVLLVGIAFSVALGAGALTAVASFGPGLSGAWASTATSEESQIIDALKDANHARAVAARTFDLAGISRHFGNDPAVPLTGRQSAELARNAPGASTTGLLTHQLAYFQAWRAGARAFARVRAAQQAGQLPDPKDVAAAIPPRVDPIRDLPMTVHLVQVSGDHAYVEAENEAQYFRVTLVKRGPQWLVVGENNTGKL